MITIEEARSLATSLTKQGMPVVAQSVRDLAQQVEDLQADAARYRKVRTLKPFEFQYLFEKNLAENIPFDTLIDEA